MKIGDKKFVMTILMMSLMEGEIFILREEIFNRVFQCKMRRGCIGFHIKFIRLFLGDNFATLHRWCYIFSIDNMQKLCTELWWTHFFPSRFTTVKKVTYISPSVFWDMCRTSQKDARNAIWAMLCAFTQQTETVREATTKHSPKVSL